MCPLFGVKLCVYEYIFIYELFIFTCVTLVNKSKVTECLVPLFHIFFFPFQIIRGSYSQKKSSSS